MTVTFHPTFKRSTVGFLPMVCIRGAKGRMIGSRIGTVEYSTTAMALAHATCAAQRVELAMPELVRVA